MCWVLFCSNSKARNLTSKKTILCHFYVAIVKSDFSFKTEKDAVVIRFGVEKLGGWKCTEHRMSVEK